MARPKDTEKRTSINRAALEMIASQGLGGLRMQAVAQFAGVATGTVYIYYRGKHDLINQLFLETRQRIALAVQKGYRPEMPFMDGFEQIWRNYLNNLVTRAEDHKFVQQCLQSAYLTTETLRFNQKIRDPLRDILERGKREKLVADIPTDVLAAQITGSLREIVRIERQGKVIFTPKALHAIFAMAWNSVKR
ncbi:MAG: TetR/AcrR family transcriptional regulator [Saprospiraceae bacterium]|nr:TetR/AcrR family transcriptional regulator [Saprospiraceae bacterium]